MEPPGVTFSLQWRKIGSANRRNITKIGLWDPDNSKLDWRTFKTYVRQNLGTVEDIDLSYIDSSEEELAIESEQAFRDALVFARKRARSGKDTVLRVHQKNPVGCNMPKTVVPGHVKSVVNTLLASSSKNNKTPIEQSLKSISRINSCNSLESASNHEKKINKGHKIDFIAEKFEPKNKEHTDVLMTLLDKLQKLNLDPIDTPPPWFHSYMRKFKGEIIAEVTSNFLQEVQQAIRSQTDYNETRNCRSCSPNKTTCRQKVLKQLLSSGEIPNESNELKILKEIEKLRKREKKLERKFDFKLRKLEHKTKRIIEKRSRDKMPYRRLCSLQRSGELHFSTYLMDALLVNECKEVIVSPGEHFTKVWEVKNTGNLPWTDKTELRQVWGASGLEPENIVAEVPPLQPGEIGTIMMEFRAPEYTGSSNSYWHFHHKGDRFGHWLPCSVQVKASPESPLASLHDIECHLTKKNIQHNMIANFCSRENINTSNQEMNTSGNEKERSINDKFGRIIEHGGSNIYYSLKPVVMNSETENVDSSSPVNAHTQKFSENIDAVFKSILDEPLSQHEVRIDGKDENCNYSESEKTGFDNSTGAESKRDNDSYRDTFREKVYVVDPLGRCFAFKPPNPFSRGKPRGVCCEEDPCGSCFAFSYATNLPGPSGPKISVHSNTGMNGTPRTQSPASKEKRPSPSPTSNIPGTHSPTSKEKRHSTSTTRNNPHTKSATNKEKRRSSSPTTKLPCTNSTTSKEERWCSSPLSNINDASCSSGIHILSDSTSTNLQGSNRAPSISPSSNSNSILIDSTNNRERKQNTSPTSSHHRPHCTGRENILSDDSYTNIEDSTTTTNAKSMNNNTSLINMMNTFPASMARGAASVATTALKAARSVVNTCRESLQDRQRQSGRRTEKVTYNLDLLEKMGFKDSLLNFQLLHKHNNDINKVLSLLLTIPESD